NAHVLVEDRAADLRAPPDVAVVEDHRVLDHRAGVHAHVPTQHRVAHHAAGQDAHARHVGVEGLHATAVVVEGELGGGIGVAGGAQRPLAVVEIEGRAY